MYPFFFKRLLDILISFTLLCLAFPILVIVSVGLSIVNRGTPFFVQPRPGKHGKIFRVIKFKTMTDARDASGKLFPDADRLTAMGKLIRTTSIDELPQLINVLLGDMSLVGPRPLLEKYLPLYNERQAKRHNVRPGITGWAQVNGRNAIAWQQRFELDIYYVENLSFALDLKIVLITILKVLKREGISSHDSATMQPFRGNNE